MLGNWWRRRKIRKLGGRFYGLLELGETEAALRFFQQRIAAFGVEAPRELRLAYHFHAWLAHRNPDDFDAVKGLAAGCPAESQAGQAWINLQQLQASCLLAEALQARSLPSAEAARIAAMLVGDSADLGLMKLALAMLRVLGPASGKGPRSALPAAAIQSLAICPAVEELPACQAVWASLMAWSALTAGAFDSLLACGPALVSAGGPAGRKALLAAAHQAAKIQVSRGDIPAAMAALARASCDDSTAMEAVVLDCGLTALAAGNAETAARWFAQNVRPAVAGASPVSQKVMMLAAGVSLLGAGQYTQAREMLRNVSGFAQVVGEKPDQAAARRAAASQGRYLLALSLLASTGDWALPEEGDTVEAAELARQTKVANRSLWGSLQGPVETAIAELLTLGPEHAWRAHFLAGLVAYVDNSHVLDLPAIQLFAATIDRMGSDSARRALKAMEGVLIAKALATEKAIEFIQQKRHEHLRELKDTILAELGDAVPPMVRAAVYMTLWDAFPSYDPLADLKAIPLTAAVEELVGRCIRQVQAVEVLAQLRRHCLVQGPAQESLPPLQVLADIGPPACQLGALAASVVHLRRNDLPAAGRCLEDVGQDVDQDQAASVRFHLAWKRQDAEGCKALANGPHGRWVRSQPSWEPALAAMSLLSDVDGGREDRAWDQLLALVGDGTGSSSLNEILGRVVFMLLSSRQTQRAHRLLRTAAQRARGLDPAPREAVERAVAALSGPVAAQADQFTTCMDHVERTLSAPPDDGLFSQAATLKEFLAWSRLLRVLAELGLTSHASDEDLKARWQSVRRTFQDHEAELLGVESTEPYAFLLAGMFAFLSSDILVDDGAIQRLGRAQRALNLSRHGLFLQEVMGKLVWRKRVIEDFWRNLASQRLNDAREIYQKELLPAFGTRMPHSIQLGMVIVDWDAQAAATEELLDRLEVLRHEASELGAEVIDKARDYILEGEKLRHLVKLLKEQRFRELVEQIDRLTWIGLALGSMPLPVAVARLYGAYKLQLHEDVMAMAKQIADAKNYAQWVTDDAGLLLGYVLFHQQKYPDASEVLGKIGSPVLLGHDVDRYWAAAQFNHGLQLLKVEQKDKAFEAFGRSLGKAAGSTAAGNLTPLFIHFGLQGIEMRNGQQALQSFELLAQSLESTDEGPQKQWNQVLAEGGQLLCKSLAEGDVSDLGADRFLALLDHLPPEKEGSEVPPALLAETGRSLRLLALCQELRRQVRLPAGNRAAPPALATLLQGQIRPLETVLDKLQRKDPILLMLKGLIDLLLVQHPKIAQAIKDLDMAIQLGVQSGKLVALLTAQKELLKNAMARVEVALDLFDVYLSCGEVPAEVRAHLVRNDDLAALYRLSRGYLPAEIAADETLSGTAALGKRMEELDKYLGSPALSGHADLAAMKEGIQKHTRDLQQAEGELKKLEKNVMDRVAELLRAQTLEDGT